VDLVVWDVWGERLRETDAPIIIIARRKLPLHLVDFLLKFQKLRLSLFPLHVVPSFFLIVEPVFLYFLVLLRCFSFA